MQKTSQFSCLCADGGSSPCTVAGHPPVLNRNFNIAIIETIVFLSAIVLADKMFGDGSRFVAMGLHPFWIIVLAVTLQYGPSEALAAALLASAFLLVGNVPEQNLMETMYEYLLRVAILPFLWIATALILGSIRSRQINERSELVEKLKNSEEATDAITSAYKALKQVKEQLELRLAGERRSVLTVYKAAESLEGMDSGDTPQAVMELVRVALNPAKCSLFRWKAGELRLEAAHGWQDQDKYATHYAVSSQFARSIVEKNHALNITCPDDEAALAGEGILAGVLRDKRTGKVFGMLKIEEIGFMEMGMRNQEIFQVICEWIAHAYARNEMLEATRARKKKKMVFKLPIPILPHQVIHMQPEARLLA